MIKSPETVPTFSLLKAFFPNYYIVYTVKSYRTTLFIYA